MPPALLVKQCDPADKVHDASLNELKKHSETGPKLCEGAPAWAQTREEMKGDVKLLCVFVY